MGGQLVKAAYAAFFFEDERAARADYPSLTMNERAVLVYMCAIAKDDDSPPRYWGGRDALARNALGRVIPAGKTVAAVNKRRSIHECVRVAVQSLVAWGAVEPRGEAYPGRQQEYGINVFHLVEALRSGRETLVIPQGAIGPSAMSPWAIRNERLRMRQSLIGPKTKETNKTKKQDQDHDPAFTYLDPVESGASR